MFAQLATVRLDRSPGYPFKLHYKTNEEVLDEIGYVRVAEIATARLIIWLLVGSGKLTVSGMEPFDFVRFGLKDPSSVFIKDEPHPRRKVIDKRYRCITPVSLIDQLVESVLFTEMSTVMKTAKFWNGSAIGIGFHDEGNQEFQTFLNAMSGTEHQEVGHDILSSDMRG